MIIPSDIIAGGENWRTVVSDLVTYLVEQGRCFTSGEVAAIIRTHRPDLVFRVSSVGDYIRGVYYDGTCPSYPGSVYPTQVPRITSGVSRTLDGRVVQSRTPSGALVFVYAPSGAMGFEYDFEVFIPDWDDPHATRAVAYTGSREATSQVHSDPATGEASMKPSSKQGVLILGALQRDELIAVVRPDRRLCVPRGAFESFVALSGIPLRGGPQGDPVYVEHGDTSVHISRKPSGASIECHLWATRGRLAFPAPRGRAPFKPGDEFPITVTAEAIVIDIK